MELGLLYVFAFVCGTMLAASVGATEDSSLKRSKDSPDDENPFAAAAGGKESACDAICRTRGVVPKRGKEREERVLFCKERCEKGDLEWKRPSMAEELPGCVRNCNAMTSEVSNKSTKSIKSTKSTKSTKSKKSNNVVGKCKHKCYMPCKHECYFEKDAQFNRDLCLASCQLAIFNNARYYSGV